MKAILKSVKSKILVNVCNYGATLLIAKQSPKDYVGWIYLYCGKDRKYQTLLYRPNKSLECSHYIQGKVVARFWCDKVEEISYFDELQIPDGYEDYDGNWVDTSTYEKDSHWVTKGQLEQMCLSYDELHKYLGKKTGYAVHISDLEIFDKPKDISEFKRCTEKTCIYGKCHKYMHCLKSLTKAPANYCYVEV